MGVMSLAKNAEASDECSFSEDSPNGIANEINELALALCNFLPGPAQMRRECSRKQSIKPVIPRPRSNSLAYEEFAPVLSDGHGQIPSSMRIEHSQGGHNPFHFFLILPIFGV
jgi:hypothetical protein